MTILRAQLSFYFKKKIPNFFGILIIILIVAIIGRFIYQNWILLKEETKVNFIQVSPPKKQTMINTTNWKIYKSDNFEIKYPEDWDVWPTSGPGYPPRGYNLILRKEKGIGEISEEGLDISVNVFHREEIPFNSCVFKGKEITVTGIKVTPLINIFPEDKEKKEEICKQRSWKKAVYFIHLPMCFDKELNYQGESCKIITSSIDYLDYYFLFSCQGEKYQGIKGLEKCEQLFDQIVSTFRFISR
jgi:hypothetical protein